MAQPESRGIPEVQYYDGRIGGEVNKLYTNIVNVEPYKCPRYQQGYLEELQINPKEKGDKDFVFLKGRKGFKSFNISNDFDGYEFVDDVVLNGDTHLFFAINYDKTKAKIGKLEYNTIVDVSSLVMGFGFDGYFEFEEGLSEKLTKNYFVGKKVRNLYSGHTTLSTGSGIKKYEEGIGYYFVDDNIVNGDRIYDSSSILPGDYLYIIDTGEVGEISLIENNKILISGAWRMDITGPTPENGGHDYIIFSERTETAVFQTKKGPIVWHNIDEGMIMQMLPGGSLYGGNLKISGMEVYQDNLYFIDKKSGRLYYGGGGIHQLVVGADRYTDIGHKYFWLNSFQDYIIMSGPSNIGAAYGVFIEITKGNTIYNLRWQDLVDYVGVWGEHAIESYPEGVQFIGSDGLLYGLGITPTGTATGILVPSLQPQSYYVVDDIKRLNKDANIYLRIEGMDVKIFINNKRYPNSNNELNTKILLYDYHHRFWYKRMLKGIHINNLDRSGIWYGIGAYKNEGDTDLGNHIKQIVSAVFGEGYSLTGKYITMGKFLVGQSCKHTKGSSEIKIRYDNGGRSKCIRYDNLGTASYVKYVMDVNNGGTIGELPNGATITDGNGVPGSTVATLNSEFDSYESYESSMQTSLGIQYNEDLSKRGKVKLSIGEYADVLYIDIVAQNGDVIDFGGYMLGFSQTDTDTERLSDTLGLET